ncbi:MAG: hypothetical protein P1V81_12575 [Planctomycetota bacterium]|nr:hypothetical protein [Planctomycetota bacterium]
MRFALAIAALALSSACQTIVHPRDLPMPELARAKSASDIGTYRLHRVGILPPVGDNLPPAEAQDLQELLFGEFSATAPFEVVLLRAEDLAEIDLSDPYRRGVYKAETIVGISRRYKLDGMLVGTVLSRQDYPPLRLDMHIDLVAAETGMAIWTAAVGLRGDRPEVRQGLEAYYGNGLANTDDSWATALLSPTQFSRFAANQLARTL